MLAVSDAKMAVNYGLNKVRFPAPVPVGSKVRLTATLKDVEEVAGGLQVTVAAVIEREGGEQAGLHRRAGLPLLRLTVRDPGGPELTAWLDGVRTWSGARGGPPPRTVAYGHHPDQVADLWLPEGVPDPPVVVSLHGGYFRAAFGRDLHDPIGRELARRGFAVWNVEYRRTGTGGGLRETTGDAWAAVDAAPGTGPVAVFGHSAGGYLAEWVAAHPRVELAVPLAGVLDPAGVVRAGWDRGGGVRLARRRARRGSCALLGRRPARAGCPPGRRTC